VTYQSPYATRGGIYCRECDNEEATVTVVFDGRRKRCCAECAEYLRLQGAELP
jgi:hypothetical protein